jgi:hypothetical protein
MTAQRIKQAWMGIMWPAFLSAGVLEMLVFAVVDPQDLHWMGHPLEGSSQAIYTLTFFVFWGVTAVSSALTALLMQSSQEVNQ